MCTVSSCGLNRAKQYMAPVCRLLNKLLITCLQLIDGTALTLMKILIAYDGSDCARDALKDLKFAGLPAGTEAIILTVSETWLPSSRPDADSFAELNNDDPKWPWRKTALKIIAESEKFALEAWESLRTDFPAWRVLHETTSGYPE